MVVAVVGERDFLKRSERLRISTDAVYNQIGDEAVLIHMKTNQIYELNRTARRLWELLESGADWASCHRTLMQEFDVPETQLTAELEALLALLQEEQLLVQHPDVAGRW